VTLRLNETVEVIAADRHPAPAIEVHADRIVERRKLI
jgi:hypothetical protein